MLGITRQQLKKKKNKTGHFCSAKALLLTGTQWWVSAVLSLLKPRSYQSLTITPEQYACVAVCCWHMKRFGILRDEKHRTNVRYC